MSDTRLRNIERVQQYLLQQVMHLNADTGGGGGGGSTPAVAQIIDVAATYGVVANGTTDNATALMAMNADIKGSNYHYYLIYPAGEIRYSDNRWLTAVRRYTNVAYGTTFRSTSSSPYDMFRQPIANGDMFYNYPPSNGTPGSASTGFLFNTANAGAASITTTTAGQAANFAVGNRVFLYGYDQQHNGYPPNCRYFQWNVVTSVNAGTGVVGLKYPLKDTFLSTWEDNVNDIGSIGKPRIINLDRGLSSFIYPYHAEFIGCTMGIGTMGVPAGGFGFAADTLICRDVTTESDIWPSQNRVAKYYNCTFASSDLDKLCDDVYFEGCKFVGTLFAGTGFNKVYFKDCYIQEEAAILSKDMTLEGCTVRSNTVNSPLRLHPQAIPSNKVLIKDLRLLAGPSATFDSYVDLGGVNTFTVDGISGTSITLVDDSTAENVVNAVGLGTWLQKQDGTKGGYITSITHSGSTFTINGTWTAPVAGETWIYRVIKSVIDLGGHTISNPQIPLLAANTMPYAANRRHLPGLLTTHWKTNMYRWFTNNGNCIMDLNGFISDITVIVSKPCGVAATLRFQIDSPYTQIIDINLQAVGSRYITPDNSSGAKSGDTLTPANLGGYKKQVNLNTSNGIGGLIAGLTTNNLPEVDVIMRWMPGSTA